MKRVLLFIGLMAPFALQAQDFLESANWCGSDPEEPLYDFSSRYCCWDGHKNQGILAWRNDTLFFAEHQHYTFIKMHQLIVPQQWMKSIDAMAEAAVKTASYFHTELIGASLAYLYHDYHAACLQSPVYGRAVELSRLFDSVIVGVMEGDTLLLHRMATAAQRLGCSFRSDYPLIHFRPTVGVSYRTASGWWPNDQENERIKRWLAPLIEHHDWFTGSSATCCEPGMMLNGRYVKVCQQCDRDVDSAMIVSFALGRREEFVSLSRALCVSDYHPRPVEITFSDTVTQRQCFVNQWRCYMLLPTTDRLTDIVPPSGQGYFLGTSCSLWHREDEQTFTPWWNTPWWK